MKTICNISYAPEFGERGVGDLLLPDDFSAETPVALAIHGGAWNSLDKNRMTGISYFLCENVGMAVFNINYRLASDAVWPGCGDDCLRAARTLWEGALPGYEMTFKGKKLLVIGASSGGHLALMTGLRLPPEQVSGIISISGINSTKEDHEFSPGRYTSLLGHVPSEAELREIDPLTCLKADSPPVLCTHEINDNVVPVICSQKFAAAAAAAGSVCRSYYYSKDETGFSHRIFVPGSESRQLYPDVAEKIKEFIVTECMTNQ